MMSMAQSSEELSVEINFNSVAEQATLAYCARLLCALVLAISGPSSSAVKRLLQCG